MKFNRAFGNSPFDILWDQKGPANEFTGNRCDTSSPDGLCVSGNGGGDHHGDGDHGDHGDNGDHGHHGDHHGKHGKHQKHHGGKKHRD